MAQCEPRVGSIKWDKDILHKGDLPFLVGENVSSRVRRREKKNKKMKTSIFNPFLSVGIRRAKNISSSTQRGLRVGIENTGFLRGSSEEFGKSKVSGLGSVHETSYSFFYA